MVVDCSIDHVTVQEKPSSLVVRGYTLEQSESVANAIGGGGCKLRRVQKRVD